MVVHGGVGQAEFLGDFLGAEPAEHEPQAFTLAGGEGLKAGMMLFEGHVARRQVVLVKEHNSVSMIGGQCDLIVNHQATK